MLFKEDILKILINMNLPKSEYWITSGAGLVLHGIKETTRDIDIGCTTYLVDWLISQGYKYQVEDDNSRIVEVTDLVEIFENWYVDKVEFIDEFPVAGMESIKKQKLKLGREKDYKDIKLIDEFMQNKK